jgi:3-hydroxyisobutyrate dehydrogenase-like beta-hydroxyacid dehydrogenase
MSKERIGFIGVGLMGHGMAKNIVEKGHPLTIMGNRNRAPVENLVGSWRQSRRRRRSRGGQASDIIFLCVSDSKTVEALVLWSRTA